MNNQTTNDLLLDIKNLNIYFQTHDKLIHAVKNFSLQMKREKVAIVGESGAGKSQTARAILGLCRGQVKADKLYFENQDLNKLSKPAFKKMRADKMAMIMQDPKYSLNPILKIGNQMHEVIPELSKKDAYQKMTEVLESVNIRYPKKVLNSYPFELSGGMGQRVMIAQTLLVQPDFLVADEPTSSIDATAKMSVLNELDQLVTKNNMGLLFISHDLPLVSHFCDRVLVMYQGVVVESLDAKNLKQAKHPYTKALLSCIPKASHKGSPLQTVDRNKLREL